MGSNAKLAPHWRLAVAGATLALAGCKVDTSARLLTLRNAVVPGTDCSYTVSNPTMTDGYYDPAIDGGGGATFAFLVENYGAATGDELVSASPQGFVANVDVTRHNAQLEAVEGCFFATNTLDAPDYGLRADGSVIDCDKLPQAQRSLAFTGITVEEGKGLAVFTVRALMLSQLRALFGDTFDPANIPVVGPIGEAPTASDTASALPQAYSLTPAQPLDPATRSAAWGSNYPKENTATVLLQLRARAKMQSGGTVHSNWYVLPVTVCPGCLRDACGPLLKKVCARGPCQDGSPCLADGTCAAGSPLYCAPIELLSGKLANWHQPGSCLPAQNPPGNPGPLCDDVGCG